MNDIAKGDKSKAICETCNKIVTTTFEYSDIKIGGTIVEEVLQGICDDCGTSVSIPHQSTHKIQSVIGKLKSKQ